ncbi:UDP-N-acetylmuramate--L-alanine ligase [Dirofilaria immitis]
MRLLLCYIIFISISGRAILCYVCHVYSQDLNKLQKQGYSIRNVIPKSILLATNCSLCFGIIRLNVFITGCRRHGLAESRTLNEFYGVICSRNPTYCGFNLCCCASTSCYDQLRNHFLRRLLQSKKDIICDVYRQPWIRNRRQGFNRSSYPTLEQLYKRTDCDACASRVDEEGVEMICIEEDINTVCHGMDLFVGGDVICGGNGDCCCQGKDCSEALRNFYSGHQKMLGTPRIFGTLSSGHCPNALNIDSIFIHLYETVQSIISWRRICSIKMMWNKLLI